MGTATIGIGRSSRITFEDVSKGSDGEPSSVLVAIELQNLRGNRQVAAHYAKGFQDLSDFFEDLAEHWAGWSGIKTYESFEGDLLLAARHTGHVELGFTLQHPSFPESWCVRGELILDPGEEMTKASQAIKSLLT